MAKKNNKAKYKKEHELRIQRYLEQRQKRLDKLHRRKSRMKEFNDKMEANKALKDSGKLKTKHTEPVIGSKIKLEKMNNH